jgi:hypothetical protein
VASTSTLTAANPQHAITSNTAEAAAVAGSEKVSGPDGGGAVDGAVDAEELMQDGDLAEWMEALIDDGAG